MNTRDLQAFVAVVESGSMVRAAEKLFLTQPGLTRRVQNLETMLGAELLDRQSKPLKPTAAGNEVYGLARTVLRAVDDLMAVASPDSESTGELRIGVPPFLSELALERPVDRLRSAFPKLTLRVTAGWSPGLLQNVERGAVDAAVVLLPVGIPLPEAMTAARLGDKRAIVVAPRSFGLTDEPTTLAELSRHPWVLNQDGCGMRSALSRAMSSAGLQFNVAVEAFGSELQLSLVARGMGIGLAVPEMLERSAYRESLQRIDVTDFHNVLNVWLVHGMLPGRLVRPVALMRDALVEKMESDLARSA
ncbi:LysR family transcriptional regulator [Paraburkholderia fungorum]|jgi:DNA-binding transcriptional LysR family regulator|uniref:LysR family transcriptional regulator n=1 Tax=Paraburkholderia fungorum TaxID=134537 RepID=UPI000DB315D5|nr:LysR family transcriptional regulator [Paraburkholderia fungorum]PZR42876.1 MAG: LysR family transcriptional regulator [Paraburkholderia fungorum]QLD51775.1 LysR family transcriptional regulator [Paraburkholderia fungorum]USU19340.1 LysR family transcriptional regulator [Paraburkholderia fungorum]USU28664.1 LysR family transcriptional regulator [Paraburkholderia fungorum]